MPTKLEELSQHGFEIEFVSHAEAILSVDFPEADAQLYECLSTFEIPIEEILGGGGGESQGTQRLRRALDAVGWKKLNFTIEKVINGVARESISHEMDHVKAFDKGVIALEIEWNNKDPFFDRDLENFKRLHAEGAISLGILVTRGSSLQSALPKLVRQFVISQNVTDFSGLADFGYSPTRRQREAIVSYSERNSSPTSFVDAFVRQFVSDKFGTATTHWGKLEDRLKRGVGNPCPLILIGLPDSIVAFDKE